VEASGGYGECGAVDMLPIRIARWFAQTTVFSLAVSVGAQSTSDHLSLGRDTQVRGYWIDPATGLMWAGKDNGKHLNWQDAKRYCSSLRLEGHSDWRLPTLNELQGVYDKGAVAPGINPKSHWHEAEPMGYHVQGNLFLTGDQWSSTEDIDDRGRPDAKHTNIDFINGVEKRDDTTLLFNLWGGLANALCVRRP